VLELRDLFADCGCDDVEPFGGTTEVQLFGRRDEISELA
jgi:hypothetical protein